MVFEGTGSLFYSPTFSLGIRNPLVAAVVGAAVQVTMMEMAIGQDYLMPTGSLLRMVGLDGGASGGPGDLPQDGVDLHS